MKKKKQCDHEVGAGFAALLYFQKLSRLLLDGGREARSSAGDAGAGREQGSMG